MACASRTPDCRHGYKEITERLQMLELHWSKRPRSFAPCFRHQQSVRQGFSAEVHDEGILPAYRRNYYGGVSIKF